jgi:hypothetical protein
LSPTEWIVPFHALLPMNPPTWLDERGQPRPKRPSRRCGREIPVVIVPTELLKSYGWQPWQLSAVVEWCGHQIEGTPVPDADGRWRLIVVEGEAK